jgi:hypothetical protein
VTVVAVVIAVGAAQVGDLVTFVRMVALRGPGAEMNPIVGQAVIAFGVPALAVVKVALVVFVVSTFAIVARRYYRVAFGVAVLATLAGILGAWSNILALG